MCPKKKEHRKDVFNIFYRTNYSNCFFVTVDSSTEFPSFLFAFSTAFATSEFRRFAFRFSLYFLYIKHFITLEGGSYRSVYPFGSVTKRPVSFCGHLRNPFPRTTFPRNVLFVKKVQNTRLFNCNEMTSMRIEKV